MKLMEIPDNFLRGVVVVQEAAITPALWPGAKVVKTLSAALGRIPADRRPTAKVIVVDADGLLLQYTRPETDDEYLARWQKVFVETRRKDSRDRDSAVTYAQNVTRHALRARKNLVDQFGMTEDDVSNLLTFIDDNQAVE